ncbi:hypothetical protein [Desulfohalovibrio reitneri]|uniref:hypothetical protein n=1 Tax=Desulfohalovibrio reitneri TaxID=1307759 RepID=UPI0004A77445|nr:hypothetical protein [Desulfohalovibrio reitneri]
MRKLTIALAILPLLAFAIYLGAGWMMQNQAEKAVASFNQTYPALAKVEYDSLDASPFSRSVTLHGVDLKIPGNAMRTTAFVETAVITLSPPDRIAVDCTGVRPNMPAWMEHRFRQMEYDPAFIRMQLNLEAAYDPEEGRLDLDAARLEAPGMGLLELGAKLRELPAGGLQGGQLAAQAAFTQIAQAEIAYTDHGLTQKRLALAAKENNLDPAVYTDRLADIASQSLLEMAQSQQGRQIAQATGEALSAFLRDPGTLRLGLDPDQPTPLMELALFPPAQIARHLNLSLHVNQKRYLP